MIKRNPIKFVDITARYADCRDKIMTKFGQLIDEGAFVGGNAQLEFEQKLSHYIGVKYAIGCSDGTAALKVALLCAGIQAGDNVIVPTNSYIASANAVVHAGGIPVFVDCDQRTYLIELNQVEDNLKTGKVRFVMPVHLYGNPCPMNEVMPLCEKYHAKVIEDNAQAIGASFGVKRTGSFSIAAGMSFYPSKNLGAFGQGGAVLTNDENLAKMARAYAEQGQGGGLNKYRHDVVGYNDRLHSIQALVLDIMLDKVDVFNSTRLQVADWYAEQLPADRLQARTVGGVPVYHLFEYRCDSQKHREAVAKALKQSEIGFGFHYPVPIHKQKAYQSYNDKSLPVAERLAETLISLPMHPFLSKDDVNRVCDTVLGV